MNRNLRTMFAVAVALASAAPVAAQDSSLQDRFTRLAIDNARGYLMPVTEGLGHALTAGFAEAAHSHKVLGFDVGLRAMAATPPASAGTFQAVLPGSLEYDGISFENPYRSLSGSLETPSAVGKGDGIVLTPDGDFRAALLSNG